MCAIDAACRLTSHIDVKGHSSEAQKTILGVDTNCILTNVNHKRAKKSTHPRRSGADGDGCRCNRRHSCRPRLRAATAAAVADSYGPTAPTATALGSGGSCGVAGLALLRAHERWECDAGEAACRGPHHRSPDACLLQAGVHCKGRQNVCSGRFMCVQGFAAVHASLTHSCPLPRIQPGLAVLAARLKKLNML